MALTPDQARFLNAHRVARLATADGDGAPHVVPVCFCIDGANAYITIDKKPKKGPARDLKRLRNIAANPQVALVADHYDDDDWSHLAWVMVRGPAEILESGPEHAASQTRMQARYPQLAAMDLTGLPVIAIRIERATSWGNLDAGASE